MEDVRFFHQQANRCYQLAWQSFDLRVAQRLNVLGNEHTAKARELRSQNGRTSDEEAPRPGGLPGQGLSWPAGNRSTQKMPLRTRAISTLSGSETELRGWACEIRSAPGDRQGVGGARLAAILAGESPVSRGVQSLL